MALDEEDKKTITEMVTTALAEAVNPKALGKVFNAAFTDRETQAEKKRKAEREAELVALKEELTGSMTTSLSEALVKFRPAMLAPAGTPPPGAPVAPVAGQPAPVVPPPVVEPLKLEETPEWKAMQGQLKSLQAQAKKAEDEKKEAQAQARKTNFRTKAIEALAAAGVKDTKPAAQAFLVLQGEGLIRYSDEGKGDEVVFLRGGAEEPIDECLQAWTKSDGRHFLPPKIVPGSGAAPGGNRNPVSPSRSGGGTKTAKETLAELKAGARVAIQRNLTALSTGEDASEPAE